MRALLASITCHKGALSDNAAEHLEMFVHAHAAKCDLVVFPEMSLTGSVDPLRHPEHAIGIDDDAIQKLTRSSAGLAAVLGICERAPDGAMFIAQIAVRDGAMVAIQRKRHLGDDEHGFGVGTDSPVFDLGGHRVGMIVCAESTVDHTWDATVAAGADVVVMCSAPGLHGRRTTETEWREGFEWWEGAGLGDARRHARRLGVWVAMATQAGSTVDEDFPGMAALVSPDGEVVSRLPDHHPGTLVVDLGM